MPRLIIHLKWTHLLQRLPLRNGTFCLYLFHSVSSFVYYFISQTSQSLLQRHHNITGSSKSVSYLYLKHCSSSQLFFKTWETLHNLAPEYLSPHQSHTSPPTIPTPPSLPLTRLLFLFPCWLHPVGAIANVWTPLRWTTSSHYLVPSFKVTLE